VPTYGRLVFTNNSSGVLQFRNAAGQNIYFVVEVPQPPADYDVQAAVDILFQGLVIQRPLREAAATYCATVGRALNTGDVSAILAAANVLNAAQTGADYMPTTEPAYPTTLPTFPDALPRYPDAYGGMSSPDGWVITRGNTVVDP